MARTAVPIVTLSRTGAATNAGTTADPTNDHVVDLEVQGSSLMPSTVVVRGAGGAIFEMDVPTSGPALDRWNEKLDKGDISIVSEVIEEPVEVIEVVDEKPAPRARTKKAAAKDVADGEG